ILRSLSKLAPLDFLEVGPACRPVQVLASRLDEHPRRQGDDASEHHWRNQNYAVANSPERLQQIDMAANSDGALGPAKSPPPPCERLIEPPEHAAHQYRRIVHHCCCQLCRQPVERDFE